MNTGIARYAAQGAKLCDRDGRTFAGHYDDAATGSSRAVVLAHDFFGLTPRIRGIASRLASEGFLVFAPDLYRGKIATTREEAAALARGIAWNQVAVEMGLAISALKLGRARMRVATLGFAMGGAASIVAAAAVEQLDAAVTFYGIPQDVTVENRRLRLQGHFADHDLKCSPERVAAFAQSLMSKRIAYEIHRYDAQNGFFGPASSEAYSQAHADKAWARTLSFLADALE